ncbi:single-stranded DNA-binding protein [Candidatus Mycoplasma pogonae]
MINQVILGGYLAADPVARVVNSDKRDLTTIVVGSSSYKNNGEADFIYVSAFGQSARYAAEYLKKGNQVIVEGRLKDHKYVNKNGEQQRRLEVIAFRIHGVKKSNNSETFATITELQDSPFNEINNADEDWNIDDLLADLKPVNTNLKG